MNNGYSNVQQLKVEVNKGIDKLEAQIQT